MSKKVHYHVLNHLPFFFPFALNIVTGTSYSFLFVLFFIVQITYALLNELKIQNNCVENKIIKAILNNLGLILTFFCWINLWGAMTSQMPFVIRKG